MRVDRPKAADMGVQIADAAEALRLLVGGDQVTTYNEGGEQYEVHLRAQQANRSTQEAVAALDGAVVAPRRGVARQRRELLAGLGAVRHQPAQPPAPGDGVRQPAADGVTGRGADRDAVDEFQGLKLGSEYRGALAGRSKELESRRTELHPGVRDVARLHVSDSGGAIRIVAASDHDSAVAAADAAVRAPVDHDLPAVAEHPLGARPAGAVRRRQEELDPPDRPREPAEGDGPVDARRRSCRPAATGCVRS